MNRLFRCFALLLCITILTLCFTSCSSVEKELKVSLLPSASDSLSSFLQSDDNSELKIPEAEGNAFFTDSVFIGDSVTLSLKNYVTKQRNNNFECLSNAEFLCNGSMSYYNSTLEPGQKDAIHPKYQGETVLVEDGVKKIGAKRAFIMLGMNDFCLFPFDEDIENAETLINRIIENNPEIEIYVQSVTPIIASKEHGKFTNENVDEFNACLIKMCKENGWNYIDINQNLKDENNCLNDDYCSDPESQGIHLKQEACEIWVNYLISQF
ncbi:MAG: hypothetical protein IJK60_02875 [Clostridia bacterium]|nr:hypothetical protein [Clostridia bacterium]